MRTRLALALVLPLAGFTLAPACAPTHADQVEAKPEPEEPEPAASPASPHAPAPARSRAYPRKGPSIGCGRIVLQPAGQWERGERLAAVREGWHPRAEHGRPVGIRTVSGPVSVPDHELFQVKVEHSPHPIQPCWLSRTRAFEDEGWSRYECLPAEVVVSRLSIEDRPHRAQGWAKLLGTFDDAVAVFASELELDRCVEGLPAAVRAKVPPLGRRHTADEEHVTFVEWIDVDDLSLLLSVHATLAPAVEQVRLDVERHELMRIDHRRGQP